MASIKKVTVQGDEESETEDTLMQDQLKENNLDENAMRNYFDQKNKDKMPMEMNPNDSQDILKWKKQLNQRAINFKWVTDIANDEFFKSINQPVGFDRRKKSLKDIFILENQIDKLKEVQKEDEKKKKTLFDDEDDKILNFQNPKSLLMRFRSKLHKSEKKEDISNKPEKPTEIEKTKCMDPIITNVSDNFISQINKRISFVKEQLDILNHNTESEAIDRTPTSTLNNELEEEGSLMRPASKHLEDETRLSVTTFSPKTYDDWDDEYYFDNNKLEVRQTTFKKEAVKISRKLTFLDSFDLKVKKDIKNMKKRILRRNSSQMRLFRESGYSIEENSPQRYDNHVLKGVKTLAEHVLYSGLTQRMSHIDPQFRFELPIDLTILENINPSHYLSHYCRISSDCKISYTYIFTQFCIKATAKSCAFVKGDTLYPCLQRLLQGSITSDQFKFVTDIANINDDERIRLPYFLGLCALSDRLFTSKHLTDSSPQVVFACQKSFLETADFSNLDTKLKGVNLSSEMKRLLFAL